MERAGQLDLGEDPIATDVVGFGTNFFGIVGANTAARVDASNPVAYDLIITNYSGTVTFVSGGLFEIQNNFEQASGTLTMSNIHWRVSGSLWKRIGGTLNVNTSKLELPTSIDITNPANPSVAADLVWCATGTTVTVRHPVAALRSMHFRGGTLNWVGGSAELSVGVGASGNNAAPSFPTNTVLLTADPGSVAHKTAGTSTTFDIRIPGQTWTTDVSRALANVEWNIDRLRIMTTSQVGQQKPVVYITNVTVNVKQTFICSGGWTSMRGPQLVFRDAALNANAFNTIGSTFEMRWYASNSFLNAGMAAPAKPAGITFSNSRTNHLELVDSTIGGGGGLFFDPLGSVHAVRSKLIATNMDSTPIMFSSGASSLYSNSTVVVHVSPGSHVGSLTSNGSVYDGLVTGGLGTLFTMDSVAARTITNEINSFQITNFTIQADSMVVAQGTVTLSGGTLSADSLFMTNTAARFIFRNGILRSKSTLINNGLPFTVGNGTNSAILNLLGGDHGFARGLTVASNATLTGFGTVTAVTTNRGTLSPGNPIGLLHFNGSLTLSNSALFIFELGGYAPETQHDAVNVTGLADLKGALRLVFENNFVRTVTNGSSLVLLSAASIAGGFGNVNNGARLVTSDGLGSFVITNSGNQLLARDLILTDTDSDGIPDWWEMMHFGGATAASANEDTDGDGLSNLEEFLAGTDPNNSGSSLRILSVQHADLVTTITFPSAVNKSYSILWRADLLAGEWSILTNGVLGTGSDISVIDPDGASERQRFYRVGITP